MPRLMKTEDKTPLVAGKPMSRVVVIPGPRPHRFHGRNEIPQNLHYNFPPLYPPISVEILRKFAVENGKALI